MSEIMSPLEAINLFHTYYENLGDKIADFEYCTSTKHPYVLLTLSGALYDLPPALCDALCNGTRHFLCARGDRKPTLELYASMWTASGKKFTVYLPCEVSEELAAKHGDDLMFDDLIAELASVPVDDDQVVA